MEAEWRIYTSMNYPSMVQLMARRYLNQSWSIVNWTRRNKLRWNLNWNSYIFIQEYVFESTGWKIVAI